MKRNYCFIQNFNGLKIGSFIYKVQVGKSIRDKAKLALLQQYAMDCGCYLRLWSDAVLADIEIAEKRYLSRENDFSKPFRMDLISVHLLYKMIIDGTIEMYEANKPIPKFQLWITYRNNPAYIEYQNKIKCNTVCQPHRRKNLSIGRLTKGVKEAI